MSGFVDQLRNVLQGTTPGPWERDGVEIIGADGCTVTFVEAAHRNRTEYSPNADLVAAAPELLAEALRRLDPGDTDINALVAKLRAKFDAAWAIGLADELPVIVELLERAFGEPS